MKLHLNRLRLPQTLASAERAHVCARVSDEVKEVRGSKDSISAMKMHTTTAAAAAATGAGTIHKSKPRPTTTTPFSTPTKTQTQTRTHTHTNTHTHTHNATRCTAEATRAHTYNEKVPLAAPDDASDGGAFARAVPEHVLASATREGLEQ